MEPNRPLVVALEGGGSKTVALAVDGTGQVVARGRGESSLALYVGDERASAAVEDALTGVVEAVPAADVVRVSGAMVGKGFAADPWDVVRRRFPGAQLQSLHEGDAALYGATLETAGVVVLSGTGAFGRAVGVGGHEGHVGGNGPLVGDEGSGHWIAVEAIRDALWSRDGREGPTVLAQSVCQHYGLEHLGWIIGRLYGPRAMGRREVASLAPAVVEAHRAGDAVAGAILRGAARLLAAQAVAAIRKVQGTGDGWSGPIPFGCSGGVLLGSPELRAMVAEEVCAQVPDLEPREPRLPPVGAVALLALAGAGLSTGPQVIDTLAATLPPDAGAVRSASPSEE
jgi:N-acetylglucosamine kinase-like BadF-type ATPase